MLEYDIISFILFSIIIVLYAFPVLISLLKNTISNIKNDFLNIEKKLHDMKKTSDELVLRKENFTQELKLLQSNMNEEIKKNENELKQTYMKLLKNYKLEHLKQCEFLWYIAKNQIKKTIMNELIEITSNLIEQENYVNLEDSVISAIEKEYIQLK